MKKRGKKYKEDRKVWYHRKRKQKKLPQESWIRILRGKKNQKQCKGESKLLKEQ